MSIKDNGQLKEIIEQLKANHMATFKEAISEREIESLLRLYYTEKRETWLKSRLGDLTIPEYQGLIDVIRTPTLVQTTGESPLRQKAMEAIDPNEMARSLQAAIKQHLPEAGYEDKAPVKQSGKNPPVKKS